MKKILLVIQLAVLVAVISIFVAPKYVRNALLRSGVISEELTISGTGSIYSTFPKEEGILKKLRFATYFFSIHPSNPLFRSDELQTGVRWV